MTKIIIDGKAGIKKIIMGNKFYTKEGFELVKAGTVETKTFFKGNGIYAYVSAIGYSHREDILVYFVSGTNGDEFGQYTTESDATQKAREMVALTEEERKAYDQ